MKNFYYLFLSLSLILSGKGYALGDTPAALSSAKPTPTLTFEQEKQQLELDRLELENEKLKLEMEKLKAQAAKTENPTSGGNKDEEKKKAVESFAVSMTQKAAALAKDNKDKENILVVDFANTEIWNKGVRYNLHEIYALAADRHLEMKKTVDEYSAGGATRFLYRFKNVSLLIYEDKERGILSLSSPSKEDDFQFITPDGISFDSSIGDVRNAGQNPYFKYDGEKHENKLRILKYIHPKDLTFSDRLEVAFGKDEKLVNFRFGVLDEH